MIKNKQSLGKLLLSKCQKILKISAIGLMPALLVVGSLFVSAVDGEPIYEQQYYLAPSGPDILGVFGLN